MNRSAVAACCLALLLLATSARAGKYNPVLSIGDAAPAWEKLPGVDGKQHALSDLKEKKLVVVVFTCNTCPIANDYDKRLLAIAKKYADDVGFVAINVNKIAADSMPEMKKHAEELGYTYPYVRDDSQKIAQQFGAIYTPEVFLLDADRKLIYMGGIDDNSIASQVKETYLEPAIQAALAGKPPAVQETTARGCRIRFERVRRTR